MSNNEKAYKEQLLKILQWFHSYCVENGLRYYILCGTMLGAARHKGFIPWDDDIDVGMPRKDYERFLDLADGKMFGPYTVESPRSEAKEFWYYFSKVYDTQTTLIENNRKIVKRGLYIDVFPLDGIGQSYEESLKNYKSIVWRMNFLTARSVAVREGRKWYKNLAVHVMQCIPDCIVNEKALVRKITRMSAERAFDGCAYVGNLPSAWREKELIKREIYGTPTLYQFEHLQVYGVEDFDAYLTALYGDWRELPPEDKRVSHHSILNYDLNSSYLSQSK